MMSTDQPTDATSLARLVADAAASRASRREPLRVAMRACQAAGQSCAGCSGVCCTTIANSMQITPLEALDLYQWLVANKRWNEAIVQHLRDNAMRYGLDRPPLGDGRRVFSRRHYTCPFYVGGAQGCSVSRQAKPYGCLAFNARSPGVSEGENCGSDQKLLHQRESCDAEEPALNANLGRLLQLDWDKKPLPTALLAVAVAIDAN